MTEYTINQGECLHSVAVEHGFNWETLWNHASNARLKNLRRDPSVLNPGDVLMIPEKTQKQDSGATELRHRFRRKGTPAQVAIKVLRNDQPRAHVPFTLDIDGRLQSGKTDGQGLLKMNMPPNAQRGILRVGEGAEQEVYRFKLGTVDTVDTERGARERLRCLGYDGDAPLEELFKAFQGKERLDQTGQLDQPTQTKISERFGE